MGVLSPITTKLPTYNKKVLQTKAKHYADEVMKINLIYVLFVKRYVSVIGCTALSGKELHRQVGLVS